jgi:hypothetical protein
VTRSRRGGNGEHYSNWCDKEVRKQLEFGFWAEAVGQGPNGESRAGIKKEDAEKEIGSGKEQVVPYPRLGF